MINDAACSPVSPPSLQTGKDEAAEGQECNSSPEQICVCEEALEDWCQQVEGTMMAEEDKRPTHEQADAPPGQAAKKDEARRMLLEDYRAKVQRKERQKEKQPEGIES